MSGREGIGGPPARKMLLCLLLLLQCTPQIRYANRLPGDPFFQWAVQERSRLSPQNVLEETEAAATHADLNDRALAYAAAGKPHQAERIFYDILKREPKNLPAYNNLMRLYALLEETEKLDRLARRLSLQGDTSGKALLAMAKNLTKENRIREARALYRALFRQRHMTEAGLWLAAERVSAGDDASARDFYESVLEQDPKNQEALFALGWIYARLPHNATALAYLNAAHRAGYRSPRLSLLRAQLYEKTGQDGLALKILREDPQGKKSLALLRLRGHLLLKLKPAKDLRFLIQGLSKGDADDLLQEWYGSSDDLQYRNEILPEYQELY